MSSRELNGPQKAAVEHEKGPLMIIAGAGTGKTRVITERVLALIQKGVRPEAILAITFTNKAAKEMRDRVSSLMSSSITGRATGFSGAQPYIGTFHSLGVRILREHGDRLGIPKRFSVADRDDALSLIKRAMKELDIDPKQYSPGMLQSLISKHKNEGRGPADVRGFSGGPVDRLLAPVWEKYESSLAKDKALDFDDLLVKTVSLLSEHTDIGNLYRERFSHIHVDEYQDTNTVQYELVKLLSGKEQNVCIVGDHDQCIYTWRSADLRNLQRFERDFPNVTIIFLEENYRSTQTILAAANQAISLNEHRKEKTLFTNGESGEPIELYTAANEADEASWVASRSEELIRSGVSPEEIAVLFRANFQSRALEEAFLHSHVPYQVLGVRFFERKEIKDVLSYILAAENPDGATHLSRAIATPSRGIGKTTLLKILSGQESTLPASMREKVRRFKDLLARIKEKAETELPSETLRFVISESGMEAELSRGTDEEVERLGNIKELVSLAKRYDALVTAVDGKTPREAMDMLLEESALVSDQDELKEKEPSVKLMTIHAAKGLEFEHVFIVGLEEGLFPSERSDFRETPEEREEERRLFYVALTRAKRRLHLSFALMRTIFGTLSFCTPSRFLSDIDASLVESVNPGDMPPQGGRGLLDIDW